VLNTQGSSGKNSRPSPDTKLKTGTGYYNNTLSQAASMKKFGTTASPGIKNKGESKVKS